MFLLTFNELLNSAKKNINTFILVILDRISFEYYTYISESI